MQTDDDVPLAHAVQAVQGAKPLALYVEPATHGTCAHEAALAFHAKPLVALQPHVLWPGRPSDA